MDYVHLPEGSVAHSGHGVKARWDERTVRHGGRDVLYLLTDAVIDTECCGDRVFHYATVLGYVTQWKTRTNESGLEVSLVEPLSSPGERGEVEAVLKHEDQELQVRFRSESEADPILKTVQGQD